MFGKITRGQYKGIVTVLSLVLTLLLIAIGCFRGSKAYATVVQAERLSDMVSLWEKNGSISDDEKRSADKNIISASEKIVDKLKKHNLFVFSSAAPVVKHNRPAVVSSNPVKTVDGILGDEALINGKWYKQGSMIDGKAKILLIGSDRVVITFDGRKTVYRPMDTVIADASKVHNKKSSRSKKQTEQTEQILPSDKAPVAEMNTTMSGGTQMDGMFSGIDLDDDAMMFIEKFGPPPPEMVEMLKSGKSVDELLGEEDMPPEYRETARKILTSLKRKFDGG